MQGDHITIHIMIETSQLIKGTGELPLVALFKKTEVGLLTNNNFYLNDEEAFINNNNLLQAYCNAL